MTFEEMQEAVYVELRDYMREFVEDHHVEGWLNEAQRDLAQRTKLLTKEITQATVGAAQFTTGSLGLPVDFIDTVNLRLGTDDVNFEVDDQDFWAAKDNGWFLSPPWGRVFGNRLEVYPAPSDNASYTLRYAYMPADLDAPEDVSPFPSELQDKMVLFAKSRALYKEREDSLAATYRQEYELGLPERTLGFGRKTAPQNRVRFEPNAFDLDPESKHIILY